MESKAYNGWKNRQTRNVALWINSDPNLRSRVKKFMGMHLPSRTYAEFVVYCGIAFGKTPDGIKWISEVLDYPALNAMMIQIAND